MATVTSCSKCNRVLWSTDADDKGRCEDCRPAASKDKDTDTDTDTDTDDDDAEPDA